MLVGEVPVVQAAGSAITRRRSDTISRGALAAAECDSAASNVFIVVDADVSSAVRKKTWSILFSTACDIIIIIIFIIIIISVVIIIIIVIKIYWLLDILMIKFNNTIWYNAMQYHVTQHTRRF